MTHAVKIQNVSKCFGKKIALQNVSFAVPEGSVFALLGENGAGKSTLIRSMLGYHRVDSGEIRVLELDPQKQSMELRRLVGYVSDAPAFYEWMTVEEIGAFAAGFYPNGYYNRFLSSSEGFQLPRATKIRDLSKGMRSKVALALATASEPRLLVLDEPTSGLDPLVRRQFLESMVDRAADGQTVFLSSHQIHEVERVADWVSIIHRGVLQVCEPIEELKRTVTHVSFSMRDPLLPIPAVFDDADVISAEQNGRQWQLMVRNLNPRANELLEPSENIFDFQSTRPSLEELYIAFTRDTNGTKPSGLIGTELPPNELDFARTPG